MADRSGTLLVATRSPGKLEEIRRILAPGPGLRAVDPTAAGMPPASEEEGLEVYGTFLENARAKARHFAPRWPGWTLAEDSGLEVDALGGAPGVRSKRFAPGGEGLAGAARDEANNTALLGALRGVAPRERTARFRCAAVLVSPAGKESTATGVLEGVILEAPRGSGGFGYDPVFLPAGMARTLAEILPAEKDRISHRARALRALRAGLRLLDASSAPG